MKTRTGHSSTRGAQAPRFFERERFMIHFDEIFYGNLSGGLLDGYCAITLELGTSREASASSLIQTILGFGRSKIFRMLGDFKKSSREDLFTLFSTLQENGYITACVLDGKIKEDWMDRIGYKIVHITEGPWLLFKVEEIHFQPVLKENIQPPNLSEIHSQARCYLDVNRDLTAFEVFDFLKKYPMWRLFSPPSKTYRMALTLKEDEE